MLHWLKNIICKAVPSGTGDPHRTAFATALAECLVTLDLRATKAATSTRAEDIVGYVLTGEPARVLQEAARHAEVAEHLGLRYGEPMALVLRNTLYAKVHAAAPAQLMRWGKVLAAASQTQSPYWLITVEGDRHWLEALLLHAASAGHHVFYDYEVPEHLTADLLEAALVEDGAAADALVRAALSTSVYQNNGATFRLPLLTKLSGFGEALRRHVGTVRGLLRPVAVPQRLHVLDVLARADDRTLAALGEPLAEHATASSKQVRAAAEPLARRAAAAVVPLLRTQAVSGKPEQRLQALRLLGILARDGNDHELAQFARDTAAADKAPSVQALAGAWDAAPAASSPALTDYAVPRIDWRVEITSELDAALAQFWGQVESAARTHRVRRARGQAQARGGARKTAFSESASKLRAVLLSEQPPEPSRDPIERTGNLEQDLIALVRAVGPTPACVVKILTFFDALQTRERLDFQACRTLAALHERTGRPTLLELRQLLSWLEGADEVVLQAYCAKYWPLGRDWPAEHIWPFFAHELDLVLAVFDRTHSDIWFDRDRLFAGIATLPATPAALVDKLFALALGPGKSERRQAQDALAKLPDKEARIVAALADGRADTRTVAAQWLRRLGYAGAVPALEAAMQKERHDVAKGALLDALAGLGCPIERYLDRDRLRAEAQRGLAKGLPKDLHWLRPDRLPTVRWREGGAPVAPEVLLWLCAQATKQKSPEPNTMLRKYCAMWEPSSAQEFGQVLLESWLAADVEPIPPEQAHAEASAHAQTLHHWIQHSPQHFQDDPNLGLSVEEMTAKFLPRFLAKPRGSTVTSKGVLALVAACGGEGVAAPVARYLKQWYGSRAAQGRALITMLAWIEHPTATQLMLSVGNRFRTKSFQEEATRQAEALAERRGWTLAELADRTMPTAGFDERGVLELDFGSRCFTAHLGADLSVELRNPEGKKISALPSPRSDDDPELAKAAKAALSAAKKELKTVVALQTDRLYEALCTGRDWSAADWTTFLQPHPLVRHLLQRLVWLERVDGQKARTFRPLDDGTLTDVADTQVRLDVGTRIALAHDTLLDAHEIAAWQQHFVDYEVKPLFQQLGKGTYALPPDRADDTQVRDFLGHLLSAFALRGRAGKLGYARGPTEDGGWFCTYEKRFPSLGLRAILEFTGNGLPEVDRTVALRTLSFRRTTHEVAVPELRLGDVPAVLLSECYHDLRLCAAEGTGFAADWEKRTEP